MLGPNRLYDIVDDITLKLRRREEGIAGIGAHTVGEDCRTHQMDALGVELVTLFPPFPFVQVRFPLEAAFQV